MAGFEAGYCLPDFNNDRNDNEVCECELNDSWSRAFCNVSDRWAVEGAGSVEARMRERELDRRSSSDGNRLRESGVSRAGNCRVVNRWINVVSGLLGGSLKYV